MTPYYLALAVITLLVSWGARPLGGILGVIDVPDGMRKNHPAPTPLTAGIAIMLPIFTLSAVLAFLTDDFSFYGTVVIAIAAFFVLGFADDRAHLRPTVRLLLSIMLCILIVNLLPDSVVSYFDFTFVSGRVSISGWDLLFTIMALAGFVYAVNMTDGMNGLTIGMGLIWSLLLLAYAPPQAMPLLIALIGCLVVALIFNLFGRHFLGDSGSYALSIFVALMATYSYRESGGALHADVVVAWFIIPVADCIRLVVERAIKGRSPMSPDTDHFHHILCRQLPVKFALLVYWGMVGVPGLLALLFPSLTVAWIGLVMLCYAFALVRSWVRASVPPY